MATAVQKIASLSNIRDIPFNKLVLSQSNVRRVKGNVSIEDLAESIAHRGLLQNLNVRPMVDAEGQETGVFEVPAGGRRFRALELLVKAKRLAKTAPVACNVREADSPISAEEDSLAENTDREDLHPLDQFRAFQALVGRGLGIEDIAARFFVTPQVVKQRLKLASVSSNLLDVYAEDGMTHWGALFKAALLSTILSVGSEAGASNNQNSLVDAIRRGSSDSISQTGRQVVGRSLNVQPTITIRPGFPVRVIVTRDLVMEPYQG